MNGLPDDCVESIMGYLDVQGLFSISLASKRTSELFKSERVWRSIFLSYFPSSSSLSQPPYGSSWLKTYKWRLRAYVDVDRFDVDVVAVGQDTNWVWSVCATTDLPVAPNIVLPNKNLVTFSGTPFGEIKMWDCTDLLTATPAHTEQPSTATSESAITEKRLQIRHFYSQQGHSGDILAIDTIRWHGVQYLITGSADSHVSVWTVEPTGLQLVIKQAAGAWVRSVQLVIGRSDSATDNLSITGQYEQLYAVYSGETQQCQILNVSSKTVVNPTPGENVNRCKIIPAADLGVAGLSNGVIVWQLSTNTILHRMVPSSTAYYIATYYDVGSSDHPLALTGMSSGAVYLLDLATGEVLMSGNSHSSNVMGTAFVSRNIGVSFSSDRSVHIWDFRKLTEDNCGLKPKRQLTQHTDIVVSGTYCEGILFSGAGDNKLLAWKPRLKHEVAGNSY